MEPPLALRLKVYLTRGKLDRQLAGECRSESTAALTLRAQQLVRPCTRQEVARNLRAIVDYVDRAGSRRISSAVVVNRAAGVR